jgi:hypothetical protein
VGLWAAIRDPRADIGESMIIKYKAKSYVVAGRVAVVSIGPLESALMTVCWARFITFSRSSVLIVQYSSLGI